MGLVKTSLVEVGVVKTRVALVEVGVVKTRALVGWAGR